MTDEDGASTLQLRTVTNKPPLARMGFHGGGKYFVPKMDRSSPAGEEGIAT
jgi:hypothetical protein